MSYFNLITSVKYLFPKRLQDEVMGVRVSTYEFGGNTIQPITDGNTFNN